MYEEELEVAHELADQAGEIGMRYFGGTFEVRVKQDLTPVTQADTEIEAAIREVLAKRFPEDAVLGEEGGMQGEGNRVWVIDPVDGTKNFAAGIQVWATLIALLVDDVPVLGMASAPALGERYEATTGGGAFFNGQAAHVSDVSELKDALICTSGWKDWMSGPFAEAHQQIADAASRTRAFGDFWGHMLVARGSAEAMLEPELRIWDWAALKVVVEEAGGRITALDGGPLADRGSALASNGLLHEELSRRFR
jgi:histidinol-phosphatase